MAAIKTLKEYIERSDAVLNEDNNDEAKDLQKEILAAFGAEYEGLSVGLARPIGISGCVREIWYVLRLLIVGYL